MTKQMLEATLQAWLDAMTGLSIDIHAMNDLPFSGSTTTSTLFVLEGTTAHLERFWQVTKELELLPLVAFCEKMVVQVAPQEYHSLLVTVLAVSAEQWNFIHEREMSKGDE